MWDLEERVGIKGGGQTSEGAGDASCRRGCWNTKMGGGRGGVKMNSGITDSTPSLQRTFLWAWAWAWI